MIDALLHAVRDVIREKFLWDERFCEIMDDEMPPAKAGDWFASIYSTQEQSTSHRNLDVMFGFNVTLTRRLKGIPLDHIGISVLAPKLARKSGWNKRADDLKNLLHMNWNVLNIANQYMCDWEMDAEAIYGFCEAARYTGREKASLVGPAWFGAVGDTPAAIKGTLFFDYARRFQPPEVYV
jgi:hypothetical protein